MTRRVEIVLSLRDPVKVQIHAQNGRAIEIRTGQHFAQGTYDAASTSHQNGFRIIALNRVEFFGTILPLQILATAQYKTAALQGDVLHGRQPYVPVVRRGAQ